MLKIFKRSEETPKNTTTEASESAASRVRTDERRRFPRPLPLPEVIEGNGDGDWAMWEESVSQQNNPK